MYPADHILTCETTLIMLLGNVNISLFKLKCVKNVKTLIGIKQCYKYIRNSNPLNNNIT